MARPKKIKTLSPETSETEAEEVKVAEESVEKKRFRAFMANYKLAKPEKYAIKEPAFIKHLNTL